MTGDVFEEHPFGGTFPDDPGNLGPKVAGIIGTAALARGTEGLARIPGQHRAESASEWSGIEAAQIVPDWGRGQIPCALGSDEDSSGPILPLDEGAGVVSGLGEHDAQIQASAACAEGQSVPGT